MATVNIEPMVYIDEGTKQPIMIHHCSVTEQPSMLSLVILTWELSNFNPLYVTQQIHCDIRISNGHCLEAIAFKWQQQHNRISSIFATKLWFSHRACFQ